MTAVESSAPNNGLFPPLPRFTAATFTKATNQGQQQPVVDETTNNYLQQFGAIPDTDQDFDLLAEYLLDDNTINSPAGSGQLPNPARINGSGVATRGSGGGVNNGFSSNGYYDVSSEVNKYATNTSTAPTTAPANPVSSLPAQAPRSESTFSDPLADANALYQQASVANTETANIPNSTNKATAPALPLIQPPPLQQQQQQVVLTHHYSTQVVPQPQTQQPAFNQNPNFYQNQSSNMIHHQHNQHANSTTLPQQAQPQQVLAGFKRPIDFTNPSNPNPRPNQRLKSQAQIDKRRERNRILARQTRLRKKFFFESLQKEVLDLQAENMALKEIVKKEFKDENLKKEILEECTLSESIMEHTNSNQSQNNNDEMLQSAANKNDLEGIDLSFICSIKKSQQCFVITDPSLYDNPIVYASSDFYELTGYNRDEVLGRNCRFLQGAKTSQRKIESIKSAISRGEDVSVCLVNYTSQGVAFWNQLFIAALRDTQGNVVNFIGVLVKVSSPPPDDLEHGKIDLQAENEQTMKTTNNQKQQQQSESSRSPNSEKKDEDPGPPPVTNLNQTPHDATSTTISNTAPNDITVTAVSHTSNNVAVNVDELLGAVNEKSIVTIPTSNSVATTQDPNQQ